jgi:hypothetical protein
MLIDVPVIVIFDCSDLMNGVSHARKFTLRYDTADSEAPAKYTAGDPQNPKTGWSVDTDGTFFGLMPYGTETKINGRAAKYPTDYCADQAEGERLQNEIEAAEQQVAQDRLVHEDQNGAA